MLLGNFLDKEGGFAIDLPIRRSFREVRKTIVERVFRLLINGQVSRDGMLIRYR
jgi:hypothetical protein